MSNIRYEFDIFWKRIFIDKVPTCFARYADGEVALMQNKSIGNGTQAKDVDKWSSPPTETLLGKDLLLTLNHTEEEYVYAISCNCCDLNGRRYLLERIKQKKENITYSNLWINCNYFKFKYLLSTIKEPVYLIGNQDGKHKQMPFPLKVYISMPNDCVNVWGESKEKIKSQFTDIFSKVNDSLVFISVGPMSEVLIDHLWNINKTNRYIDIGSSLDEYIHSYKTRAYMNEGNHFSRLECY